MPKVSYHGEQVLTYPSYVDMDTGQVLTCTPGGVYNIMPISGAEVPTDGRFTLIEDDGDDEALAFEAGKPGVSGKKKDVAAPAADE